MNKYCIEYSFFIDSVVENSNLYLYQLVLNINNYLNNNYLNNNFDIKIHTDDFSRNILNDNLEKQHISLNDNIKFIIYDRSVNSEAFLWRYTTFNDYQYEITICEDVDFDLTKYFNYINYFIENKEYDALFIHSKKYEISPNPFAGGFHIIRPNNISKNIRKKIQNLIYICLQLKNIYFNFDEYILFKILKNLLKDLNLCFILHCNTGVTNQITNYEQEVQILKNIFKNCFCIDKDNELLKNKVSLCLQQQKIENKLINTNTLKTFHRKKDNALMQKYADILEKLCFLK